MSKIYMATKADVTTVGNKLAASWENDVEAAYSEISAQGGTVPAVGSRTIAALADAISSIPGDRLDNYISASNGFTSITNNCTNVRSFAFCGSLYLTSASFPLALNIGESCFKNCYRLTSVNLPLVTFIGTDAFYGCGSLLSVSFPSLLSVGTNLFSSSAIKRLDVPAFSTNNDNFMYGANYVEIINFRPKSSTAVLNLFGTGFMAKSGSFFPKKNTVHIWCSDGYLTWSGSAWELNAYPDPNHDDSPTT